MKTLFIGYVAALAASPSSMPCGWAGQPRILQGTLGQLLLEQPNWPVAILFYLIHALGIVVFAVPLAASWLSAVLYGALFGFCRLRRLRSHEPGDAARLVAAVSLVDLAWGAVVTAAAAAAAYLAIAQRLERVTGRRYSGCRRTIGDDEAAGRHDLEAAPARIVERGTDQARGDALAFVGRRHLGVGEDQRGRLARDRPRWQGHVGVIS